jgi:hypothetical protein
LKELSQHIKRLLSTYDCVIIPNFGAFIAEYSPADIDGGKANTPNKDLLFNSQLTRNDGLLLNSIIEETDIGYAQAKQNIETSVRESKEALIKGESVILKDIGTLTQDEAGFIQFTEAADSSTWLHSYGLNPVTLSKIKQKEGPQQAVKKHTTSKHRQLITKVASVAALIALLVIFATPLSNHSLINYAGIGYSKPEVAKTPATTPITSEKHTTTPLPKEDIEVVSTPVSRTAEIDTTAPVNEEVVENAQNSQINYHIIIASLPSKQLALKHLLRFEGHPQFKNMEILNIEESGRYRISVARFSQKTESTAYLSSFKMVNPSLKDAWLLSVNQ